MGFELVEDTKEKVGIIDERNIFNENIVPLYNSIYPKGKQKLIESENLRFESYKQINLATEKLEKYINHNGKNQFSQDVDYFISMQKEFLTIISSNLAFFKTVYNYHESENVSDFLSLVATGISDEDKINNFIDRLTFIENESDILIKELRTNL